MNRNKGQKVLMMMMMMTATTPLTRTSLSPTEWVNLPEQAGGEQYAFGSTRRFGPAFAPEGNKLVLTVNNNEESVTSFVVSPLLKSVCHNI